MQKWKQIAYRTTLGPLPKRRERGLKRLYDALAETPFHGKYWINGGLLLGCIRNGGPMAHDDDADFSFWEKDRELLLDAIGALESKGFRRRKKRPNNDGSITTFSFRYWGVDYDFSQMFLVNNKMQWIGRAGEPGLELLNEVPNHGLNELKLYDRRWLKPDDHETYLESLYGDWRTPNPGYCPWEDSKAVIKTYPQVKHKKTR
ncbi:MAG: hypothetical protein GXP28_05060 [Planctomycetes bacterium]|nr:hypothetical protein [Planctomycetota bacterium]